MWGNLNNFVDKAREMGEKALEEVKKKKLVGTLFHFQQKEMLTLD